MRPSPLVLACLVALCGAATPASAGKTVYVSGRVLDPAGKPVAGARVSYELHPNRELYDQHDCPVRPWEVQCKVHKVAGTTDSAGRYRLPVKLSSYLAQKRSHDLVVTDRRTPGVRAPARTAVTVYFTGKSERIADLPLWRGKVSIDKASLYGRNLDLDEPPASLGREHTTGPTVELMQGAEVAWAIDDVEEARNVDNRVVETGTTGIRASVTRILGRLFPRYTTPEYAVSDGMTPLSRGAACATYGKDDAVLPLAKCRFTDGRLATPIDVGYQRGGGKACDVASQCAHPKWVRVDLGSVQPVAALAVRGCVPESAEVSPEGAAAFAPYPTTSMEGLLVGAPVPARYVRVDLSKCAFKATEISVFGPST